MAENRKRCHRYNDPGVAHSLTFSCFQGKPFLSRDRSRMWLIEALSAARENHHFDLWAYVIMPEHIHLIVYPRETKYSIGQFLSDVKRPVARQALAYVRKTAPTFLAQMADRQPNGRTAHRFWQRGGGYHRNLKTPQIIRSTIDYIHGNPVRRGLVRSPSDWVWSSAGFYQGKRDVLLRPDVGSLPDLPR
jgi:putative transposase